MIKLQPHFFFSTMELFSGLDWNEIYDLLGLFRICSNLSRFHGVSLRMECVATEIYVRFFMPCFLSKIMDDFTLKFLLTVSFFSFQNLVFFSRSSSV